MQEQIILLGENNGAMMNKEIEALQSAIISANRIVAITGAGISMSAGIKDMEHLDFLSMIQMMSETIFKKNPKHYYKIVRKGFLDATFINGPTVAHKKLAELERSGKLLGIVTTNIDCMHTAAGNKNVAEIQGSFGVNICLKCGKEHNDMNIWNKGVCPKCQECGGAISAFPVHSHVGLYHPAVQQARQWLSNADLILVIASKGMYGGVYFSHINPKAKIIQINPKETEFDRVASVNIRMQADDVFKQISCFERQA